MKEIVNQILEGKFDYDDGVLNFSCPKIELNIERNEEYEGSFQIIGRSNCFTEGYVYSSDIRMQCLTNHFIGTLEEVAYLFHSKGMEEGDTLTGNFYIVSNQGEYNVPFTVVITRKLPDSSMGSIRNLFHFANLAKTSWDEALKLFYSESFEQIFNGNDRQFLPIYLGLSRKQYSQINMEEFLIAVKKKQKVEYIPEETKLKITAGEGISRHTIELTKNGWGYTYLQLQTEGDFIEIEKNELSDDDFLGNRVTFSFYIDSAKVHTGKNLGRIIFSNYFTEFDVEIQAVQETAGLGRISSNREKKQINLNLMELYQVFRTKKITTNSWMTATNRLVDRMIAIDDKDPVPKLFRTQLLLTEERYNEAKWVVDQAKTLIFASKNMNPAIWCYYLYLTTLFNREAKYINEVTREVRITFEKRPDNWRLAWLMLYLSPEFSNSPTKKWLFLQEQFEKHCTSPIIYLEALMLWKSDSALLVKLESFEIQVLSFAARQDLLTREIILQLHYLVPRLKVFDMVIYRVLVKAYEVTGDEETLRTICSYLIKCEKSETKYFQWYAKGVAEGLKITRLFEFYMMSLDTTNDIDIPKMVYMYFSYNNSLDYEKKTYLYGNLLREKEKYPEIYQACEAQIESFILEQISKMHINRNLAFLYKNLLNDQMIQEDNAEKLATLLFMNRITVVHKKYRYIIVIQDKMKQEERFLIVDREAVVPIYGSEYHIFLEDQDGNRTVNEDSYRMDKLMLPGKMLKQIAPYVKESLGLDIYLCEASREYISISQENANRFERLMQSKNIVGFYKRAIAIKLLRFYYEQDLMPQLDDFLRNVDGDQFESADRYEVIRFMVIRGVYDRAFDWITQYGVQGMDSKTIVQLVSNLLRQEGEQEDPVKTIVGFYAFSHGKYDIVLLQYLMKYFNGRTKDLRSIWKAASEFDMDTYELCERLIIQMLYTGYFVGEKISIFESYVKAGGRLAVEIAFTRQCAFDYFVNEKLIDIYIIDFIERSYLIEKDVSKISMLAYTKYYFENRTSLKEKSIPVLRAFLVTLCQQHVLLPYFLEFSELVEDMERYLDKTVIDYKTRPGSEVMIHYLIEQGDDSQEDYMKEQMDEVMEGVYYKDFVLFFGETMQYYITEQYGDEEQLTESGNIRKSDISKENHNSRFSMLNDIVIGETLQDYDTVNSLLMEYKKNEYLQQSLFEIL